MAAASLLALIDDIATLLDDISVMTKRAAVKTSGVLGDDLALNAQQVHGVNADRELPVVWAVAKGSLVNKAILVPAALAISALAPWAVTPLLMLGGAFLCFEGAEKLLARWLPAGITPRLLKTDLFDEAATGGLHDLLKERAALVVGMDVSAVTAREVLGYFLAYSAVVPSTFSGWSFQMSWVVVAVIPIPSMMARWFQGSPTQNPSMLPTRMLATICGGGTVMTLASLRGWMPWAASQ